VRGRRTCIVLGAGASHAYEEGPDRLPLQRGFFEYLRYYCLTPPLRGLIGAAPCRNFNSFAIRFFGGSAGDPWCELSNNTTGPNNTLGLEEAYRRILESDISEADKRVTVESLNWILYTTIAAIVIERSNSEKICRYHRRLAELLEPGDVVISFNYDCLIDDAMMYWCPFWYPRTGYGVPIEAIWGWVPVNKREQQESGVFLLHPHGSILFRTDWSMASNQGGIPTILLLGLEAGFQKLSAPTAILVRQPDGEYDLRAGISVPAPVSWDNPRARAATTNSHETQSAGSQGGQPERLALGPLIVYPTPTKEQAYLQRIGEKVREVVVGVEYFCFVGYSLPPADQHVPRMFSIDTMAEVVVVNAARNEAWLQRNYKEAFPGVAFEFVAERFQEWILSV